MTITDVWFIKLQVSGKMKITSLFSTSGCDQKNGKATELF
jgi:hypothetical protein